jgi:hypothetical protein
VRLELQIQDNWIRLMVISKDIEKKKQDLLQNSTFMQLFDNFENDSIKAITGKKVYPINGGFNKYGSGLIYRNKVIIEGSIEKIVDHSSTFFQEVIQYAETNRDDLIELIYSK